MFSFLAVLQIRVILGDWTEEIIVRQWRQTNSDDDNNDTHFYYIILRFKCKALYIGK